MDLVTFLICVRNLVCTLREGYGFRVFENRALRRIFWLKWEQVGAERTKLRSEEIQDFTSPWNNFRMIMSRRKGEESVSDARGTREEHILFFDEEGKSLRNLNVLWSIILKLILSRVARRGVNLSGTEWRQNSGSCARSRDFLNIWGTVGFSRRALLQRVS